MKRFAGYYGLAFLIVAAGTGVFYPFLDEAGRKGLLVAGGIALAIQGLAFLALLRLQEKEHGFLLALLGGAAVRFVALGVVGVTATTVDTGLGLEPLILGLAGFLFALLLLEALFVRGTNRKERTE